MLTPFMKRSYFKRKPTTPLKRTKLRVAGVSDSATLKREIQSLLREIVIIRDGGCVLRDSPHAGNCGGYSKADQIILQGEHLVTRSNSASFADTRNIVCICRYHHITWKPQHSQLYWDLIEGIIGPTRWDYIRAVQRDASSHRAHKVDLKMEKIALMQELTELKRK